MDLPEFPFRDYEAQGVVIPGGGFKDMCGYRVRFDLHTSLSAEEVLKHYEAAKIESVAGSASTQPSDDGGGWDPRYW
ncbi:hypothetical protein [Herbidospora cretacea]|uniref:hypothetical protein n=1 Tax=Herbidospora cretacea TaxID=28444 RepID=UPI0004C411D3|nr:hypothetical protein [Herbidospora cretacea]